MIESKFTIFFNDSFKKSFFSFQNIQDLSFINAIRLNQPEEVFKMLNIFPETIQMRLNYFILSFELHQMIKFLFQKIPFD
jgi:hypothetical protein